MLIGVRQRTLELQGELLGTCIGQLQHLRIAAQQVGNVTGEQRQQAQGTILERKKRHLPHGKNRQQAALRIEQRNARLQG
ncbi:hypothetical protein D3C73_808160 [compost metagenome]